jgi:hypothetical protein
MFQIPKGEEGATRQVIRDTGNGYKSNNYKIGDVKWYYEDDNKA